MSAADSTPAPAGGTPRRGCNRRAWVREANARLEQAGRRHGATDDDRLAFLCECGRAACTELITMSLSEYASARATPARSAVAGAHVSPGSERVVEETARYAIVEAAGGTPGHAAPSVTTQRIGPASWLVALAGEHDRSSLPEVERTLDRLCAEHAAIVVDLSETASLDTSTLRALIRANRRAAGSPGGALAVIAPAGEQPARVFQVTGIGALLSVHGSRAGALAALEHRGEDTLERGT